MEQSFFKKFLINCVTYGFGSLFLGIPVLFWAAITGDTPIFGAVILFAFLFVVAWGTNNEFSEGLKKETEQKISEANNKLNEETKKKEKAEYNEKLWKTTLNERTSGFPTLVGNIDYYEKLQDDHLSNYLITKSHPAYTSAQVVKEESKRRREAEYKQKTTQSLIEYYENMAPFLLDYKDQIIDDNEDVLREYTVEEREDPVTNFLTKDEYRKLSSTERNQMALDRFWRRPKPKWLIGRLYERFVGYLFETEGYDVDYVGVFKGYEDLGRDLICKKGKEIIVIQCKNWSQFKTIFEKHIFQFFGTVFQYKDEYKNKNVKAIFYTTTELSPLARRFAKELGITLKEQFKMPKSYPCIKCNISPASGSKIYHLPFDQQYDNTKIEPKTGEFYCETVAEAEKKGFRRAFRWKGGITS